MKKILLASLFVGVSSVAMAVPVCSGPTPDITTFAGGCTAGNLLFTNFVYSQTGGAGPTTSLTSLVFTSGNVRFNINPNQGNISVIQESFLTFTVAGSSLTDLILGASTSNGGNGTSS